MADVERIRVGDPGEGPYAVLPGSDGTWLTLVHSGRLARVRPDRTVETCDLGAAECRPSHLARGADGSVWFTRNGDDRIGRLSPDGRLDTVDCPAGTQPYGLTVDRDGVPWFGAMGSGTLGRVEDGAVRLLDGVHAGRPAMLAATPDGGVWCTLNADGALGRLDPHGRWSAHPLPDRSGGPVGLAADPGGLWVAEILADRVSRVDPGDVERARPTALADGSRPHAVVGDGAGGCWATLWGAAAVVRIDADGAVVERVDLEPGDEPHGLAVDADGRVLVALESGYLAVVTPSSTEPSGRGST